MKPSPLQLVVVYAAAAFMLLGVFHRPLGFSENWGIVFPSAAIVCLIVHFMLLRRQKARGPELEQTNSPASAAREKNIRRLSLFLIFAVSLSGPWWLPYTGTNLPFPQLVVCAIITCIICVAIYVIASRRRTPKI